jgi:hypothetical protein
VLPHGGGFASHDPGEIVTDLAVALTRGEDCLADVTALRSFAEVFGGPTISRLSNELSEAGPRPLVTTFGLDPWSIAETTVS